MGAWSHEPFGNDIACDWSYSLLEGKDLLAIKSALDAVLEAEDEYLESDQASEAIAAIEVLAKLIGKGTQTDAYTENVDQWVKDNPQRPSANLLQKARHAIERISSPGSELLELWEEGEEAEAWKASLQQLVVATNA
jgi:hypothetical protein